MSVDFDFERAGRKFRSRRLDPFKQAAILKRVIPLVGPLIPLAVAADKKLTKAAAVSALSQYLPAFAESLANLKDEDLFWLMDTCLGTLRVEQEEEYVAFWNKGARRSQFEDLNDLAIWMPLTIEVIKENLTPFFLGMATNREDSQTDRQMQEEQ